MLLLLALSLSRVVIGGLSGGCTQVTATRAEGLNNAHKVLLAKVYCDGDYQTIY